MLSSAGRSKPISDTDTYGEPKPYADPNTNGHATEDADTGTNRFANPCAAKDANARTVSLTQAEPYLHSLPVRQQSQRMRMSVEEALALSKRLGHPVKFWWNWRRMGEKWRITVSFLKGIDWSLEERFPEKLC